MFCNCLSALCRKIPPETLRIPVGILQDLRGCLWGSGCLSVGSAKASFETQKYFLHGGTGTQLVQSIPDSRLSLRSLKRSFSLWRKSDRHELLPSHFFSSRWGLCCMINHNKCRKENIEIHFTLYSEWFIHTVMENILKQLRLNTTGSCWGTLFINTICTSIWSPHTANNFLYTVLYQALIGSTVCNLKVYFALPSKIREWRIMFLGWYFYPFFIS